MCPNILARCEARDGQGSSPSSGSGSEAGSKTDSGAGGSDDKGDSGNADRTEGGGDSGADGIHTDPQSPQTDDEQAGTSSEYCPEGPLATFVPGQNYTLQLGPAGDRWAFVRGTSAKTGSPNAAQRQNVVGPCKVHIPFLAIESSIQLGQD